MRPLESVYACSARLTDFILAPAGDPWHPLFARLGLAAAEVPDRLEVFGFVGGTALWAGLVTALWFLWQPWRRRDPRRLRAVLAFVALTLVAAMLATPAAARYLHPVFPAIRCYNRLVPFVVLFGVTAVALCWQGSGWARLLVAGALLVSVIVEQRGSPMLRVPNVVSALPVYRFAGQLRPLCAEHPVRIEPPLPDFMTGPYTVLLVTEAARCEVRGVAGPVARRRVRPGLADSGDGVTLRWRSPDGYRTALSVHRGEERLLASD